MDFRVTIQLKVKLSDSGDACMSRRVDPYTDGISRFEDSCTVKRGWREEGPYNKKGTDQILRK